MSQIVVVGSINVDIVSRVADYPVPGQTIHSQSTAYYYGGKGANQAVAAARAEGAVAMVGAVGTDPFGAEIKGALQQQGIDTSAISVREGATGMAYILVNDAGQNQIVLTLGANGTVTQEDFSQASMETAKVIILQNEIPWGTNVSVMQWARAEGIHVLLNPAPAIKISAEVMPLIGTLVLNELEAQYVTGRSVGSKEDAVLAARDCIDAGAQEVIVTLGEHGSVHMDREGSGTFTPSYAVKAVDTTSAGDTFIGYYAAGICSGKPVAEALKLASAAAALSVTRSGAQASIPTLEEVEQFMNSK
ncbi:ribokinase [Paenibacillus cremeus]|uniref:Ribokinase n=1 Tax=Paenibacillus cremeus TaxID=2163881 RepID=A0A559K6Z7_9BACL|nr:ribokinase [Paenibacillus cremeus]TVY07853.1 ribokinase [Paenibacillus cremeus]